MPTNYRRQQRNSKLKQLQNEFDNYKRNNTVHVNEVLKVREEATKYKDALEKIAKFSRMEHANEEIALEQIAAISMEALS